MLDVETGKSFGSCVVRGICSSAANSVPENLIREETLRCYQRLSVASLGRRYEYEVRLEKPVGWASYSYSFVLE